MALGSYKWLNLLRYNTKDNNNTYDCIKNLKEKGYRIVATSPHETSYTIEDLPIDKQIALCMGTEITGISGELREEADMTVKIPMFGFTESFNISVSTALCLHTLVSKMHKSGIFYTLTETEKNEILLEWIRQTVKSADLIEKEFHKVKSNRSY